MFHGLRKSAAVKLAEAGCTDAEIAVITGRRVRWWNTIPRVSIRSVLQLRRCASGRATEIAMKRERARPEFVKHSANIVKTRQPTDKNGTKRSARFACLIRHLTLGEATSERWLSG